MRYPFSSGKKRLVGGGWHCQEPTMALVCAATLSSTLPLLKSVPFTSQSSRTTFGSSFLFNSRENGSVVPHAKKKISFVDQILDYIEGRITFCMQSKSHVFVFSVLFLVLMILCPFFRRSQIKEMVWCTWSPSKRWHCCNRWWRWLSG